MKLSGFLSGLLLGGLIVYLLSSDSKDLKKQVKKFLKSKGIKLSKTDLEDLISNLKEKYLSSDEAK